MTFCKRRVCRASAKDELQTIGRPTGQPGGAGRSADCSQLYALQFYTARCKHSALRAPCSQRFTPEAGALRPTLMPEASKISALLISRGAKKDVRVAQWQYACEVEKYLTNGSSKSKNQVLKFIDEGQSFDVQVPVKYASADDVPKTETLTTTLWGAAVYNGDVELMRECLERGASVAKKLQFAHAGKDKVVDLQYLNGRTPYEVIMTSEDIPLENQMLAIQMLKKYGLKNEDCPKDLEVIRHTEELSLLKTSCDPYVQRRIGIGNHMVANTTVWGMAVYWGWADVIERCLELGAPARKELKYWDGDCVYDEPWEEPHLLDNGTPKELILKNKDIAPWEKNRIVKLLRKYANE